MTFLDKALEKQLIELRKSLHRHPELSGKEVQTPSRLKKFLKEFTPDEIREKVGGNGLLVLFNSGKPGPDLLLRADMDALAIDEANHFDHRSENEGVSHKCGHDGHMAIMAGVAATLSKHRPHKGRVALLFQPEEETGRGAEKSLNDPFFENFRTELVFAMHNLPGFDEGVVALRHGPFASASRGMIIKLQGASSHAAYPEQGKSPVKVVSGLLDGLTNIPKLKELFENFCLVTIIHARLGERAFGTSPGDAVVMATLRSYLDTDMEKLTAKAQSLVHQLCKKFQIDYEIQYTEVYPATVNHAAALNMVEKAANKSNAKTVWIKEPFPWSEDFGHFTAKYPGAFFGIGTGIDQPGLHSNKFDFNDRIIEKGVNVFMNIIGQVNHFNEF